MKPNCISVFSHGKTGERGSIVINFAVAIILCIVVLGAVQVGYTFYMKKDVQKAADLAALAGAKKLAEIGSCAQAMAEAKVVGRKNILAGGFSEDPVASGCGVWGTTLSELGSIVDSRISLNESGRFSSSESTDNDSVYARVTVRPLLLLPFWADYTLSATAVARLSEPVASFSVGSRLISLGNPSLLSQLLQGIGLDLAGSNLVSYNGLAQVALQPSGLLQQLGLPVSANLTALDISTLLAANVSLGQLLDAVVNASNASNKAGLLSANIELVNSIVARLGVSNLTVNVGKLLNLDDYILSLDTSGSALLTTDLNALNLLYAGIGLASEGHALTTNITTGLLSGLLGTNVAVKKSLIEAPKIAYGGVGAKAYTGQLRTYVDLKVKSADSALGAITGALGTSINLHLPIMLDAVTGRGELVHICRPADRTSDTPPFESAVIEVESSAAKVCIGTHRTAPDVFSSTDACSVGLTGADIIDVKLLGISLLKWSGSDAKMSFDILPAAPKDFRLVAHEDLVERGFLSDLRYKGTQGNDMLIGSTLKGISDAVVAGVLGNALSKGSSPGLTTAMSDKLASELWGTTPCGSGSSGRTCRINRMQHIEQQIESGGAQFSGLLGRVLGNVGTAVDGLLTLNVQSLVGGLLNTVGDLVGDLLGGLVGAVAGSPCTGGGLLGGTGTDDGCKKELSNTLKNNSTYGSTTKPNGLVVVVSFLVDTLSPILDRVGSEILTRIFSQVLGIKLGEVDVELKTLNCFGTPQLVY